MDTAMAVTRLDQPMADGPSNLSIPVVPTHYGVRAMLLSDSMACGRTDGGGYQPTLVKNAMVGGRAIASTAPNNT